MIVISNSSPIIALSRCDQLRLFQQLFGRIFIPDAVIDDKRARNEAKELGFFPSFTSDIIKAAEKRNLIDSYDDVMKQLHQLGVYLPE